MLCGRLCRVRLLRGWRVRLVVVRLFVGMLIRLRSLCCFLWMLILRLLLLVAIERYRLRLWCFRDILMLLGRGAVCVVRLLVWILFGGLMLATSVVLLSGLGGRLARWVVVLWLVVALFVLGHCG